MSVNLKDELDEDFLQNLAKELRKLDQNFDRSQFTKNCLSQNWHQLSLKERVRAISNCLHVSFNSDYLSALPIIIKAASGFSGLRGMIFPDYIQVYGLENFDESIGALAKITKFFSSEFAVRPYIIKYPQQMLKVMSQWAEDECYHIRRLSSEGCRPRLPWAPALVGFVKDPTPILKILEKLKFDPEKYVQKSVANNLNDISKDHPKAVLGIAKSWPKDNKITFWIIKHALRTLLKQGNIEALKIIGITSASGFKILDKKITKNKLKIGDDLKFYFDFELKKKQSLRMEYIVEFVKSGQKTSRKIFKIGEGIYEPGIYEIDQKHSFQELTTRKHYPGVHKIILVINGQIFETNFLNVRLMPK